MSRDNLDLVMRMMAIPGVSGKESRIAEFIRTQLRAAGAPASAIRHDRAHRRSPIGGEVGNLVFRMPGTAGRSREPARLLMAHIDTVPICEGSRPVRRRGWIASADPATGLGADNRSGAAVVLHTALTLLREKRPHPPLTFFWPVQEEVGLIGARFADLSLLGRPRLAFNFDGGSPAKLTIGATGAYRLTITVRGKASHAGVAPQHGVSAITIASLAIAELHRAGWLGSIRKRSGRVRGRGTSNVGFIHAGGPTNVVTELATLRAEVRSHDKRFRKAALNAMLGAFTRAAAKVRNEAGECGKVEFDVHHDYEAFALSKREPCVVAAARAVHAAGAKPIFSIADGGLDANWLTQRGIPTVTLGAGQQNAHTTDEMLNIDAYRRACGIALSLATGDV